MKRKKLVRKKLQATRYNGWRYKHLTLIAVGGIIAVFLSRWQSFHDVLVALGSLGYLGAFLGGALFVSTFTVATGLLILLILVEQHSLIGMSIVAGFGAVAGDYMIFRFVKDGIMEEVAPLYNKLGGRHLTLLFHTKYLHWTLPVIGALIIASPLPDEIGVSLMGIAKMPTRTFLVVSYIFNTIGIFVTLAMGSVLFG